MKVRTKEKKDSENNSKLGFMKQLRAYEGKVLGV